MICTGLSAAHLKNWDDFAKRMETQYQRYDQMGLNYANESWRDKDLMGTNTDDIYDPSLDTNRTSGSCCRTGSCSCPR